MTISPKGDNKFLIRIYIGRNDKGQRLEYNRVFDGIFEDAVEEEQFLKRAAKRGQLQPRESKKGNPKNITLNELFEKYKASLRHKEPATIDTYERDWKKVKDRLGVKLVTDIKRSEVIEFLNSFLDDDIDNQADRDRIEAEPKIKTQILSSVRVKRILTIIKAVFNFGVEDEILEKNPARKIKLPDDDKRKVNPLTVEEAFAFVSVKDDYWYGDALVFQLQTGLRNQESMALIWDDVDWEAGLLRVERACKWIVGKPFSVGKVKSKLSRRDIELAPEQLELLRAHREKQLEHVRLWKENGKSYGDSEIRKWVSRERRDQASQYKDISLIFPKHDGAIPRGGEPVRSNFKAMLHKAGLPESRVKELRWYDLRHTHATYLLTIGIPSHEVAERMGHTVIELHKTYAHVLPRRQRRASILFARLIPTAVSAIPDSRELRNHISNVLIQANQVAEGSLFVMG